MIGEKLIRIKSLFPLGIDQKFDIKSPQAKNFSSFETMRLFFCFFGPSVVLATTKGNVLEKVKMRNNLRSGSPRSFNEKILTWY